MKSRTTKLILETVGQLNNLTKDLNINKEALEKHSSTLTAVRDKLNKYTTQYNNSEYIKTLSPAEQQNLMRNARAMYDTHEILRKEIDYLDMTKQPQFISNAIVALDRSYILLEYYYKDITEECGDIVIPKFSCIQLKNVSKSSYKQLIYSIMTELDAFTHDIYIEYLDTSHAPNKDFESGSDLRIFTYAVMPLIEAYMWFKKENERLKVEALPEIHKIDLPEETTPEVPKGPDSTEKPN